MTRQAATAARQDMLIRELLERAELREMCLEALGARPSRDAYAALAVRVTNSPAVTAPAPRRPGRRLSCQASQ